jgi:hypothetical protein
MLWGFVRMASSIIFTNFVAAKHVECAGDMAVRNDQVEQVHAAQTQSRQLAECVAQIRMFIA